MLILAQDKEAAVANKGDTVPVGDVTLNADVDAEVEKIATIDLMLVKNNVGDNTMEESHWAEE